MKTLILIITLIFLKTNTISSQTCDVYSYDINTKKDLSNEYYLKKQDISYSCDLRFYNSTGKYDIVFINEFSDDQIGEIVFSYGYYITQKDTIILIDQTLNYKMILIKNGKHIIFSKGFKWFLDKHFIASKKEETSSNNWYNFVNIEQKKKESPKNNDKNILLKSGIYQKGSITISIKNQHYNLYFYKNLISSGTIQKNGNNIVLMDTAFKEKFNLELKNNSMKSILLPGDFKGLILDIITPKFQ